ncbi:DNA-directed RNA polymerase I subunit RPA12 [Procambarus clarkii]|uniref:DNA-directed RNA polymerase I subunit RPA12 n=1 Tax=Procambarus clarkii TaxID=6728 RepID=UPI001E6761A2|nr:DNA-directed RNA polymerase I subunit RPA12-like [Procambarus clarkii]XP_045620694.1 DNA-directed RNA polymerase I subunit RPA12-like [Procambarus clarkii]
MEENRLQQLFEAEPDFCPSCGAILILPKFGETVECAVCTFSIFIDSLIGRVTSYNVEFTPRGALTAAVKKKKVKADDSEFGQMDNDRECSKCGNIGMSYTTMQLRSADEGQTIFYICPKCKHREVENS